MSEKQYEAVARSIEQRRTWKVIADVSSPVAVDESLRRELDPVVMRALEDSGMAPFHYNRNMDGIAEPWRCHVLWSDTCRQVATQFNHWFDDVKPTNKLPMMLSACGALVLVTWIPQEDPGDKPKEKLKDINEEHLAAASAFTQNLLLLLTAAGLGTYWSSGGQFRTVEMFDQLGIDHRERLLAAVFVDYLPASAENVRERIAGKNRELRSPAESWTRVVELN
ncbi:MAG: nitroreductase family protein [Planctomycetota bacterium]